MLSRRSCSARHTGGGTENERYVGQIFRYHAMYFQDDWKVTPRLTLNLGLRYEFQLPPLEKDDKWSDFDPNQAESGRGRLLGALKFAGFGEGRENSRTLTKGWFGGWGPRLGMAYQLNDKTTIRAGGARTFGFVKATTGSTHFDGAILNFNNTSTDNGITPYFLIDEGIPGLPASAGRRIRRLPTASLRRTGITRPCGCRRTCSTPSRSSGSLPTRWCSRRRTTRRSAPTWLPV